jgi:hypothetical protein
LILDLLYEKIIIRSGKSTERLLVEVNLKRYHKERVPEEEIVSLFDFHSNYSRQILPSHILLDIEAFEYSSNLLAVCNNVKKQY